MVVEWLECIATLIDRVVCATYPQCSFWLQYSPTCLDPSVVESIIIFKALTHIPDTFIDTNHTTSMNRETIVWKVVWRICKDHVNRVFLKIIEKLNWIAVVEHEIALSKVGSYCDWREDFRPFEDSSHQLHCSTCDIVRAINHGLKKNTGRI